MGKKTKKLHYLYTPVHRIVDNMCIQGGDIINGDGTGVSFFILFYKRGLLFTEIFLWMKISKGDTLVQVYFQWQIKEETLILLNSILLLNPHLISMESMLYLDKSSKEWKLSRRLVKLE